MNSFTLCSVNAQNPDVLQRLRAQCAGITQTALTFGLLLLGAHTGLLTGTHLWAFVLPSPTQPSAYPETLLLSAVSSCLAQAHNPTLSRINGNDGSTAGSSMRTQGPVGSLLDPLMEQPTEPPMQPHWFINSKGHVLLFKPETLQWQPAP
jgi:hypothetical protein